MKHSTATLLDQVAIKQAAEEIATANCSPKTVLGFFAILVGILVSGAIGAVGIFAKEPSLHRLIVPVLLFAAAVHIVIPRPCHGLRNLGLNSFTSIKLLGERSKS